MFTAFSILTGAAIGAFLKFVFIPGLEYLWPGAWDAFEAWLIRIW